MHGQHQWVATEGTIVDVESRRHEHKYAINVRKPSGALIQGTLKHKSPTAYTVGTKVRIEIAEDNEIRFDPNSPGGDPVISVSDMTDQIRQANESFNNARGPSFGAFAGPGSAGTVSFIGGADVAGLFGALSAAGGGTTQVIGPDGQPVQVDAGEMSQLAQVIMSGDPVAKQAAVDRLHQIRAGATAQQPGQPGAGPADQAPQPVSAGTVEQRLAKLRDLLGKGIVTQSEYETQRQRIIDGI